MYTKLIIPDTSKRSLHHVISQRDFSSALSWSCAILRPFYGNCTYSCLRILLSGSNSLFVPV